jgi:CHAT domain-containing protein
MESREYPTALQALQFALEIYVRAGNPMETARVQGLIGQVFEQQGQFARARQNYLKALETFTRISDPLNEATVYHLLGRLTLTNGKHKEAEDYLLRSIAITEKINRISSSRDLNIAFYGSIYDRYQTYVDCLMSKYRMTPTSDLLVRAFETSETARARSLAEFLRTTHTNFAPGLDPDLAQREKSIRQALWQKAEYRSQLLSKTKKTYPTEELKKVDLELSRLEAEHTQVSKVINERYPAYRQITQPVTWDLRRIQEEVIKDDQTLLLEFSIGARKSYVWAVTRNNIKAYEIPAQEAITEAVKKVTELLVLPPVGDAENKLAQASGELSQMVLSPVAAELNKQVVIVVADGALNYIPFQILPMPSGNEPLVAKYDIVNAPSASILGELRHEAERRQAATKLLAAFGDPVFHPTYLASNIENSAGQRTEGVTRWRSALRDIELNRDSFDPSVIPPLFYAARELANLRELAGGGALVLSEFAATRDRLLSTDLTQYAMLHLATHGFLDPRRPENSGLLLSTVNNQGQQVDGFIALQDIYELRAPVLMVVLSACQTALGKDVRGEGLIGITRGFMYAGASSVVASLWKVDDGATAELMRLFYGNMLQRGMRPAEALRAAQNSIRQKPQWRSPFYWGAFTLQGEFTQNIKPTPQAEGLAFRWKIVVLGLLLLILLAAVAWWYRRRRLLSTRPID